MRKHLIGLLIGVSTIFSQDSLNVETQSTEAGRYSYKWVGENHSIWIDTADGIVYHRYAPKQSSEERWMGKKKKKAKFFSESIAEYKNETEKQMAEWELQNKYETEKKALKKKYKK